MIPDINLGPVPPQPHMLTHIHMPTHMQTSIIHRNEGGWEE